MNLKDAIPPLEEDKKYTMVFLKGYEDVLDALVCAVTAYYYSEGKCRPFGDSQGVAWVPKI